MFFPYRAMLFRLWGRRNHFRRNPLEVLNSGDRDFVDQEGPEDPWEDAILVYPSFQLPRKA